MNLFFKNKLSPDVLWTDASCVSLRSLACFTGNFASVDSACMNIENPFFSYLIIISQMHCVTCLLFVVCSPHPSPVDEYCCLRTGDSQHLVGEI